MVKSPMEYFEAQEFDTQGSPHDTMSPAELAFVQKYMGMDAGQALAAIPVAEGDPDARIQHGEPLPIEDVSIETTLREAESVQMVGFYVGSQLYALPTLAIQEVIRRQEVSQLPMAPSFVSGVINLRGHITPLIRLRALLDMPPAGPNDERFTIICRCRGLQFGVQIDQLQTMYRVMQRDLNWNAEASVGANVEFITGLFEVDSRLIPVISIERMVDKVISV